MEGPPPLMKPEYNILRSFCFTCAWVLKISHFANIEISNEQTTENKNLGLEEKKVLAINTN